MQCDPVTGTCYLQDVPEHDQRAVSLDATRPTVRYVGDPMCSWCWGIAPTLQKLAAYCTAHTLHFASTPGGLRPGGGDAWNAAFKSFLRHEWETVQRVTGQPFGFSLLTREDFDYDTEPACRAVVTARILLSAQADCQPRVLEFFSSIQRKFYVEGADPKEVAFYADLCAPVGLDYTRFQIEFQADHTLQATREGFVQSRHWGIRGLPSILLDINGTITLLASGHVTYDALIAKLEDTLLNQTTAE